MNNYRVEATRDAATGKYKATLYYPAESETPVASTAAVYDTDAEALRRIDAEFRAAFVGAAVAPADPAAG